jgi:glycosyltransferase involved in cell wall biosynthesis
MKIAYFHYIYGPGTPLNHVKQFADAARALGHQVDVHSMNFANAAEPTESSGASSRNRSATKALLSRYLHEPKELLWNVPYARRELEILRRDRPDVAVVRSHTHTVAEVVACRFAGVPLVLEVNGPAIESTTYWNQYFHVPFAAMLTERLKVRRADRVTVVSGSLGEHLCQRHGIRQDHIVVNHNGADCERFTADAGREGVRREHGIGDQTLVGFVGSFHPWHGIDLLKHLISDLAPQGLRFMTVGSGQESASFETWLARSGNERAVSFLGSIPHADIPAHVAAFDVALIADANFYVSPLKLFEYMAAERAIVAPAYAPITEVLTHEKNGLLFEPKNFGAARECVERLAADPELRARLGRAARETALDEYTWQHNAQRVIDACEQVIAARRR